MKTGNIIRIDTIYIHKNRGAPEDEKYPTKQKR